MPDHKIHITLDELLFGVGTYFPEVHKFLDSMQPVLQSNHRMFYHDIDTVKYVATTMGRNAGISALFHILLDEVSTEVGQEHAIAELLNRIRTGQIQL